MDSDFRDLENEAFRDTDDKFMEPFKYLEQINTKNKMIFNELLQYTSESFKRNNSLK
jgi:hypothetical protein